MPDNTPAQPATPATAWAIRAGMATTLAGVVCQAIPAHDAIYLAAGCGLCSMLAASWHPTNPLLRGVWTLVNAFGGNLAFAKNEIANGPK